LLLGKERQQTGRRKITFRGSFLDALESQLLIKDDVLNN
jgi:hypothetical protein